MSGYIGERRQYENDFAQTQRALLQCRKMTESEGQPSV
jgi:hypothetical protein